MIEGDLRSQPRRDAMDAEHKEQRRQYNRQYNINNRKKIAENVYNLLRDLKSRGYLVPNKEE